MTTAISGPNAAATAAGPTPATPRSTRVDPFEQLLNLQMEAFTPANAADSGWSGLGANSTGWGETGTGAGPLDQLLTYSLLRVLERLLDTQPAASGSGVPAGRPVAGPISQAAHAGHQALDIAVPVGTPIQATHSGRVITAGWNSAGYGNLVVVENGSYQTYYAHLDSIPVTVGQAVSAGDIIGLSGNTGNSTGPHLHYEVRLNGAPVAPDQAATPAA